MQPLREHLFLCLQRAMICKSGLQWALLCEERLGAEGLLFHVYAAKLELEAVSGAGGKALGARTGVENQGTLWHAVASARLSCRLQLFQHQNTDLWVLSLSSKFPGTHRHLPLAYLWPQVAHVRRTFRLLFPVPGTPCCSCKQKNMDWRVLNVFRAEADDKNEA